MTEIAIEILIFLLRQTEVVLMIWVAFLLLLLVLEYSLYLSFDLVAFYS